MNRQSIKIGNAPRGSRNKAAAPPAPPAPVVSVDMNSMTFNVTWAGSPVEYWEIYCSENPPGNYFDDGQTSPNRLPTNYWNWIGDTNVDWALYVVGCDGDGNVITPQSNVLTGHSPGHY